MPRPLMTVQEGTGSVGNFMSKPARGWLHSDQLITKKGVTYAVRYVGCLEVNTSMKSLDFDARFLVVKECISRVCEAAGLKTVDKKRKVEKRVARAIGQQPLMEHAGANVRLSISSTSLSLRALDTGQMIATHDMPRISFASGGDADTLDFVAYVAKDLREWRACYVLECGGGLAQDVITTIGQAFELRFKQFLTLAPAAATAAAVSCLQDGTVYDREYYNDLPGKVPPDVAPPPVPPLPNASAFSASSSAASKQQQDPQPTTRERIPSTNLIDLNCDALPPRPHDYVNDIVISSARQPRDVFDLPTPVETTPPVQVGEETSERDKLQGESWFHGSISRHQAESLLKQDGDFLVRESQGSAGQYVLTGLQGGHKKHLLLIDPEGVVRTKDRMFESVSHLINYHCQNQLPIISAESALVLRNPVQRTVL